MASNDSSTTKKTEFTPAEISENALVVLKSRYLLKDRDGKVTETPDQLFRRVAVAIATIGSIYGESQAEIDANGEAFYRSMAALEFLPNSPTLMNAGTGQGTLSACFVLPLRDSMEGIMAAAHDAAMVQKFGGGTGFSLSELRPKGTPISTTHGKACGPIAVLKHLSSVSTLVTQGGKRDGANMAVLDVHHPDILEFIDCKAREGTIHNFNISVGVSDEFMGAVRDGGDYALRGKQDFRNPSSATVELKRLDAREVFNKIVDGAWRNGEPGMIFLDEVNRNSPVLHIGRITATNPCGEQPLLANESCNLGSIDVGKFVTRTNTAAAVDWDRLGSLVRLSTRLLDNVIDANKYALKSIEEMTKSTRKLGLGIMGFADLLVNLGIAYDSPEGVSTGRELMRFFDKQSYEESLKLATERGPFPAWTGSEFHKRGINIRNACRLTVAPTGTISMIAQASSGIEPLFSLAYRKHNILSGKTLYYVDHNFESCAKERGFHSDDLMGFLGEGGSLQERNDVPQDVKRLFHTAPDISPREHVLMQAAFQESTDSAISKTINFPNDATVKDVEEAYLLAWKSHCKGITVYRAGSRSMEVLTSGHAEDQRQGSSENPAPATRLPTARPARLAGYTQRIRTARGNLYVTINTSESGGPFEVFTTHGKAGGNDAAMAEAVSRLVSLALRSGVDPHALVDQLRNITDEPIWDAGVMIRSVPDGIAHALANALNGGGDMLQNSQSKMLIPEAPNARQATRSKVACPSCYGDLAHEEGCLKCHICGYSKC